MAYEDVLINQGGLPPLEDYAPVPQPSLASMKIDRVTSRLAEKNQRLGTNQDALDFYRSTQQRPQSDNYLSKLGGLAQSSLYTGAGRIADTYARAQVGLGNEDFKLSQSVDDLSNQELMDQKFGVDPQTRLDMQAAGEEAQLNAGLAMQNFGDGNIMQGLGNVASGVIAAAPQAGAYVADSANTLAELAAGGVVTKGAGFALSSAGKLLAKGVGADKLYSKFNKGEGYFEKAKRLAEEVKTKKSLAANRLKHAKIDIDKATKASNAKKLAQANSDLKRANIATKVANKLSVLDHTTNLGKSATKMLSSTAFLNADMLESQNVDREKRGLPAMTASELLYVVPFNALAGVAQVGVVKGAIPKLPKGLVAETMKVVKAFPKGIQTNFIKDFLVKTAKTGSEEAAQEYLQTFTDAFAGNVDGTTMQTALASAIKELKDSGNYTKALGNSMIGFTSGAFSKGAIDAPMLATKGAVKATIGITKGVVGIPINYAKDKVTTKAWNNLSPEEQRVEATRYRRQTAIHDNLDKVNNERITALDKATSVDDIADKDIMSRVEEYKENNSLTFTDLREPKEFNKMSDKLMADYKADIAISKTRLEGSHLFRVGKKVGANVLSSATKIVDKILPTDLVETAKIIKNVAEEELKGFKHSATLGIMRKIAKSTTESPEAIFNHLKKAYQVGHIAAKDPERMLKIFEKAGNDVAVTAIEQLIEFRDANIFNQQRGKEVNLRDVSPLIAQVSTNDLTMEGANVDILANDIAHVVDNKITDKETYDVINSAIRNFRKSDKYKKLTQSAKNDFDVLKGRLEDQYNDTRRTAKEYEAYKENRKNQTTAENLMDDVVETTDKVASRVSDLVDVASDYINSIVGTFKGKIEDKIKKNKKVSLTDRYGEDLSKALVAIADSNPTEDYLSKAIPNLLAFYLKDKGEITLEAVDNLAKNLSADNIIEDLNGLLSKETIDSFDNSLKDIVNKSYDEGVKGLKDALSKIKEQESTQQESNNKETFNVEEDNELNAKEYQTVASALSNKEAIEQGKKEGLPPVCGIK